MRVLIATKGYFNKQNIVNNFAFDQAVALKKLGIDVRIAVTDLRTIVHSKYVGFKTIVVDGIRVCGISLPMRLFSYNIKIKLDNFLFYRLFKKFEKDGWIPDIIHTHFVAPDLVKTIEKTKCKFIITEHYSGLNTDNPDKHLFEASISAYRLSDYNIAVSKPFAENLERLTSIKFHVIPNILDSVVFSDIIINNSFNKDKIKIVSAGNLTKNKNFSTLINVFSKIDRNLFEIRIFGDGEEKTNLVKQINRLGLEKNVFLEGKVSRTILKQVYLESDCFILLSKKETFGVAYIEAMACGLPVVSLACGGTSEFINSSNGIIIKTEENLEQITNEIISFLNRLVRYDRQTISKSILNTYGFENVMPKLIEAYTEVMHEE